MKSRKTTPVAPGARRTLRTRTLLLVAVATGALATLTLAPQAVAGRPAEEARVLASLKPNGFERPAVGTPYTLGEWAKDGWNIDPKFTPQGWESRTRVDGSTSAHSGGKSLRVQYPKGKTGPLDSGALAPFALPKAREYYLSFWVKFSGNFSWGTSLYAGKVGIGLAGGKACSGGQPCDGTNGFTSRPIWSKSTGKAGIYYYSMDKEGQYGDDIILQRDGADINWPKDQWVNVVQRLRVNTVSGGTANPDGEIEIFYNGRSAAQKTGLRFVSNGDQIDKAYFSSFAGGGTTEFAPTTDGYIWIDDLKVSTNRADICELSTC
ncbi:hypothetical protein SZN_21571 [Streptomyces zinciresistens K42]|uniref:Polysaccharide lyase 14 domain-containing protein n=1 Tax=Streptomyces zinciresistens K42 TaxID=700597 RepID=G2GFN0_9ACTN|nr:hypothetical protein [Streptomyces zinciresistens]EGX57686.1 hypothetical protein SZN_21571 [Streptomyces zinciresistens K42]